MKRREPTMATKRTGTSQAVRAGKTAAAVLAGGGAALPAFAGRRWEPCSFGSVAALGWVREPRASDGEPVAALLERIPA